MGRRLSYLTIDDVVGDASLRPAFDEAVARVLGGSARTRTFSETGAKGLTGGGRGILGTSVLEYYLKVPAVDFDAEAAAAFAEKLRVLLGWADISYTLTQWVQVRLCEGWFTNEGSDWSPRWVLKSDVDPRSLPDSFLRFACYVAIGELKHGPSYARVSAERILGWVTDLGSDLPARLKKHGTGELPPELIRATGNGMTAHANDVLAVVRITVSEESQAAYASALDYLCRLLETSGFPRSYALRFRGPTKTYLPVRGLPKRGVHQLFAAAAGYPSLWTAIERYARAAMREHEWYTDLDGEHCAMPGTFAVISLGLADTSFAPLVVEYLNRVDGEHQSVHARFVETHLDRHGFSPESVAYLLACAGNIQELRHRASYAARIADADSLRNLLAARGWTGSPSGEDGSTNILLGEGVADGAWREALYAIWGAAAMSDGGRAVIVKASPELRPLYEAVFA